MFPILRNYMTQTLKINIENCTAPDITITLCHQEAISRLKIKTLSTQPVFVISGGKAIILLPLTNEEEWCQQLRQNGCFDETFIILFILSYKV